jgi:hypothetical protein
MTNKAKLTTLEAYYNETNTGVRVILPGGGHQVKKATYKNTIVIANLRKKPRGDVIALLAAARVAEPAFVPLPTTDALRLGTGVKKESD